MLVQQEPDASSFPNGGIRNTFEARGYSAWDPSSPVFVVEDTLCIPTVFIAYTGESLDYKAPLLKALSAENKAAVDVCHYFDENVKKAVDKTKIKRIVLAGGVSANSYIRGKFLEFERDGIKVYMPDLKLCTDNAAMIASAGYYNFISGKRDKLDLNAVPNIQLGN